MAVEMITKEDLIVFKAQLLAELKAFVAELKREVQPTAVEGYKTKMVRKVLGCSIGKLQTLRDAGKLRWKKVGGTLYYKKEDVQKLVNEGF